jgi:hypothetical protein
MNKTLVIILAASTLLFASCERHEEGELITTVEFTVSQSSSTAQTQFEDLDGPGGQDPNFPDTLVLNSGISQAELKFWNKSLSSPISITDEILEEAEDHLVCWDWIPDQPDCLDFMSISRTDKDLNGLELGLKADVSIKSGSSGSGIIRCTLKHQPGIKTGACALGETDVEVDFPVRW